MRFFSGYDLRIIIPTLLLLGISLIVLSSIEVTFFRSQLLFVFLGIVLFILFSSINIHALGSLTIFFYLGSLILLLILFFAGLEVRGAQRWLELAGFRLQFSELIKPFLTVAFASLLANWERKITLGRLLLCCTFFLPIVLLVVRQPDLGNALVYGATFVFMLFSAGLSPWYIIAGFLIFVSSFPITWKLLAQYQRDRIMAFIKPQHDPLGVGYNAIQSAIAVGSGLLLGRGLGRGVQSQLSFLPERHTDFIFATFAEEFGFVGSVVVLVLYFFLLLRMLQVGRNCQSSFEAYTILGVFTLILVQTFINIGMNMSIVPITGVTLPLFSYGGSSLLSTTILLGIVNSISRGTRQREDVLEIR